MYYRMHGALLARPPQARLGEETRLSDLAVRPLIWPSDCGLVGFTLSFESALERLATFERMLIEPDGSFVWVGTAATDGPWQLDGNLFDRDDRLLSIELIGQVSPAAWERLVTAVAPEGEWMFECRELGLYLSPADFPRWASMRDSAS